MTNSKNADKKQNNNEVKNKEYWEARQNLFGFFSLLLEVDKRINPHLYKKYKIKTNNMILHKCPECDKSFKDGEELFNHIENYHRQMATLNGNKCPYCESEKISQFALGKDGEVSFKTGEIQGDEYKIYLCDNCKHLSKEK